MIDSGKANREAIEGLIFDINDFIESVNDEIKEINKDANDLGEYWDDEQYEEFLKIVETLNIDLSHQLNSLEGIIVNLKDKLNILG